MSTKAARPPTLTSSNVARVRGDPAGERGGAGRLSLLDLAAEAAVHIEGRDGLVRLQVSDNGVGGAEPEAGSGLIGLVDCIAALDGTLTVDSPAGVGTTVTVELPLQGEVPA